MSTQVTTLLANPPHIDWSAGPGWLLALFVVALIMVFVGAAVSEPKKASPEG